MPSAKDTAKPSLRKSTLPPAGEKKAAGSNGAKKIVAPKASKKSAATTTPRKDAAKQLVMTPEERYRMIAVIAYYRAEKRGFIGGDPAQDWVDAETEVQQLIGK